MSGKYRSVHSVDSLILFSYSEVTYLGASSDMPCNIDRLMLLKLCVSASATTGGLVACVARKPANNNMH